MNEMTPLKAAENLESMVNGVTLYQKGTEVLPNYVSLSPHCIELLSFAASTLRRVASGELAEVKHAHWIDYMADKKDWLRDDGKSVFIECSACHEKLCRNLMLSEKYCPNCGAIMLEDNSHEAD
jgi:hypothetical protein